MSQGKLDQGREYRTNDRAFDLARWADWTAWRQALQALISEPAPGMAAVGDGLQRTRCWSKTDSNSLSHLERNGCGMVLRGTINVST